MMTILRKESTLLSNKKEKFALTRGKNKMLKLLSDKSFRILSNESILLWGKTPHCHNICPTADFLPRFQ